MPKQPPHSFLVIGDTNALFSRDPKQIVSDGFIAAWSECSKLGRLRLALPEIVRGERMYQMLSEARRSLESAGRNIEMIASVTASAALRLPEVGEIRQAIERRFDDWARATNIEIVPVPCSKINWPRVVSDAIWRVSPFVPPCENKDTEKGFRDCLIMETLDELIQSGAGTGEQVVFITKDQLLREATIARFQPHAFAAYEDLASFHSYLRLTHEQAEKVRNALVQQILQRAPSIFYSADNPQCLYAKLNIGSRILQEFAAQLNVLTQSEPQNAGTKGDGFIPSSDEKIFIESTEYEGGHSKTAWGWKTRLRFVRVFRPQPSEATTKVDSPSGGALERISEILAIHEIVRIAPFDVHWTARCDNQAKFSRLKLVSLKALSHSQEIGFFKLKYGFQPNKQANAD